MDTLVEQYARTIAINRGTDPDAPVLLGKPDGTYEHFEIGWKAYEALAKELLALHKAN